MNLLFFLHSFNQPSRLTSPQFTRRSFFQKVAGAMLSPFAEPVRQRARRHASARMLASSRNSDSCHFQLRAL